MNKCTVFSFISGFESQDQPQPENTKEKFQKWMIYKF